MSKKNNNQKPLGWAGKIAKYFIENSKLSLLLIMAIMAWGTISFVATPKQYNPKITAPTFQINMYAPSADSEEFYDRITKEVEHSMMSLEGVENVLSFTQEGGYGIVTVQFFVGEDEEESNIKVRQRMDEVRGTLPSVVNEVDRISITELDPDDVPVLTFALTGEDATADELYAEARSYREILRLADGVSKVENHGGLAKELRIELDPVKMEETGINPKSVMAKIGQTSSRFFVSDEAEGVGGDRNMIEVNGLFEDPQTTANLIVSRIDGQPVRIKDIGEVIYGPQVAKSYSMYRTSEDHLDSRDTVFISVAKNENANVTTVTDSVIEIADEKIELPDGYKLEVVRNDGEVARKAINGLTWNLITAIAIVAVVLLLFLGWRAAIIASVAIPLTIGSVFGIALMTGQTINRITLFALILSLGLLVDNATVIVENAVRHIKLGRETKNNAIARAVGEVGTGLFLATLTTLFAFFPMFFVTGMMGPYMQPIPFFVPVALIASLLIAYTLNPFLSSIFLAENKKAEKELKGLERIREDVVEIEDFGHEKDGRNDKVQEFFDGYKNLLQNLFNNNGLRKIVLSLTVLATFVALLLPVFQIVQFRMLPKDDKNQFYIYIDYGTETQLSENLERTGELEEYLVKQDEIESVQTFISTPPIVDFNGLFKGSSSRVGDHQVTLKVNLTEPQDRKETSEEIAIDVRADLEDLVKKYEGTDFTIVEDAPGPPVRSTFMLKIKALDRENITEENREKVKQIADDFKQKFEDVDGVVDIQDSVYEPVKTISFKVNTEEASKRNLRTQDIIDFLYVALEGKPVTLYRDSVDKPREEVFVTFAGDLEKDIEALKEIKINWTPVVQAEVNGEIVKPQADRQVALSEVAEIVEVERDNTISSDNQAMTYYIGAEMEGRSVVYAAIDTIFEIVDYELPFTENSKLVNWNLYGAEFKDEDTGMRYMLEWDGEWELTLDVFRDLGIAMLFAILLIYGILVAQFKSFKVPALILGTVPLALIGVLPGYAVLGAINGNYFNATSMIGVIALAGIVVNNAIIMVEYIKQLQDEGKDLKTALSEGAATRLRPIVLTALTTILGSLTLVTDLVWAGLGWSIVFGMTASTLLTLIIFPALYYQFMRERKG